MNSPVKNNNVKVIEIQRSRGYSSRNAINLDKISKYFHSRIIFFESHKNFVQYTKLIFTEILKLINKIAIYYEIAPDAEIVPKFFKDFILTQNRKFPHFIMKEWNYKKTQYEDEKIKTRTDGEERDELERTQKEELDELKEIFFAFDKNGDGKISKEEFVTGLSNTNNLE